MTDPKPDTFAALRARLPAIAKGPLSPAENDILDVLDDILTKLAADEAIAVEKSAHDDTLTAIPMILPCPACGARHIDEGDFATKLHHTHACQTCGLVWRPSKVATVGVRFLPGYKSGPADAPMRPALASSDRAGLKAGAFIGVGTVTRSMTEILGARESEDMFDAAARVVGERDEARALLAEVQSGYRALEDALRPFASVPGLDMPLADAARYESTSTYGEHRKAGRALAGKEGGSDG